MSTPKDAMIRLTDINAIKLSDFSGNLLRDWATPKGVCEIKGFLSVIAEHLKKEKDPEMQAQFKKDFDFFNKINSLISDKKLLSEAIEIQAKRNSKIVSKFQAHFHATQKWWMILTKRPLSSFRVPAPRISSIEDQLNDVAREWDEIGMGLHFTRVGGDIDPATKAADNPEPAAKRRKTESKKSKTEGSGAGSAAGSSSSAKPSEPLLSAFSMSLTGEAFASTLEDQMIVESRIELERLNTLIKKYEQNLESKELDKDAIREVNTDLQNLYQQYNVVLKIMGDFSMQAEAPTSQFAM